MDDKKAAALNEATVQALRALQEAVAQNKGQPPPGFQYHQHLHVHNNIINVHYTSQPQGKRSQAQAHQAQAQPGVSP